MHLGISGPCALKEFHKIVEKANALVFLGWRTRYCYLTWHALFPENLELLDDREFRERISHEPLGKRLA